MSKAQRFGASLEEIRRLVAFLETELENREAADQDVAAPYTAEARDALIIACKILAEACVR
jgi:hypothetical protein